MKDILASLFRGQGWEKRRREFEVIESWVRVADGELAGHSRALRLVAGKLTVEVDEPARGQLIMMRRQEYIDALNREAGAPMVRDIVVRRGNV